MISGSALAVGTDIVAVDRIKQALSGWQADFLQRVFTPDEITQIDPDAPDYEKAAGFWAAKEAMVKALGCGFREGIRFHDMEVTHNHYGAPQIVTHGQVKNLLAQHHAAQTALSISHCRTYAIAVVAIIAHHSFNRA